MKTKFLFLLSFLMLIRSLYGAIEKPGAQSLLEGAQKGNEQKVRKALKRLTGEDINQIRSNIGSYHSNALHIAAFHGHLSVVQVLVEAGADVNYPDDMGCVALHGAAFRGHGTVVTYLLSKHAQINFQDKKGNTALHWAATMGQGKEKRWPIKESNKRVIQILLDAKADQTLINNEGKKSLDIAITIAAEKPSDHIRQQIVQVLKSPSSSKVNTEPSELLVNQTIPLIGVVCCLTCWYFLKKYKERIRKKKIVVPKQSTLQEEHVT